MHEGVRVTKILLTEIQLQNLNVFLLVFKRGYACAMIVQTNAIQFLPELFMNQFDTVLSTLWIHIEHMHEGVFFQIKLLLTRGQENTKTTFKLDIKYYKIRTC